MTCSLVVLFLTTLLVYSLHLSLFVQYSDLAESERALVLEKFRQSTAEWSQINSARPGDDVEFGNVACKSCMIIVTDACLPLVASGEAPLLARILINYELPTKKVHLCT